MIKVVSKSLIREECIEEFKALAKELVEKSQSDRGMVYYTLNQSAADKKLFAILEAWESQEALKEHSVSPHFTEIVPKMAPLAEQSFPLELYVEI